MLPTEAVQLISQFGSTGLLLLILNAIWAELKLQNQFTREIILKQQGADEERERLRAQIDTLENKLKQQPGAFNRDN